MSDSAASLLLGHRGWLADLKGRIQNVQTTVPSWRKNYSD